MVRIRQFSVVAALLRGGGTSDVGPSHPTRHRYSVEISFLSELTTGRDPCRDAGSSGNVFLPRPRGPGSAAFDEEQHLPRRGATIAPVRVSPSSSSASVRQEAMLEGDLWAGPQSPAPFQGQRGETTTETVSRADPQSENIQL